MQSIRLKKYSLLIILTIIPFIVCAGINPTTDYKRVKIENIIKKAGNAGTIPVIIRLNVPDFPDIIQRSARLSRIRSVDVSSSEAFAADLRLEESIRRVADEVLLKLAGSRYSVNRSFQLFPFIALNVSPRTLESLAGMQEVSDLCRDRLIRLPETTTLNSHDTPASAAPMMNDAASLVKADMAWAAGYAGGNNWYVAVLDTGIRQDHEAFKGKKLVEQCYSLSRDCPNGEASMSGSGAASPYEAVYQGFGHGTHVSAIAAGNNQSGFRGIAYQANIMHVQVFSKFTAAECEGSPCVMSYNSDQLKGLEFVFRNRNNYKIAAVNMSLGGDSYYNASSCDADNVFVKEAIDNLKSAGIATVVASGNEGYCDSISSPACISSAISVGATSKTDHEASFSNYQSDMLDIFAPGSGINSATANSSTSYEKWNGTSMATPFVTGTFAIFRQFSREIDIDEIMTTLKYAGQAVETKCLTGETKPRLNVGDALVSLMTVVPPVNLSGEQQKNQSFLISEFINIIEWQANPLNSDKNVVAYKVYLVDSQGKLQQLSEVPADTFLFRHRRVQKRASMTYAVTAVNDENEESLPAYYELDFGVEQ